MGRSEETALEYHAMNPQPIDPLFEPRLSRVRVVLCNPQHPGNIGASARAMLTMGLGDLVLVNPERYPHPQARAQAAGAGAVLDSVRVVATLEEAIADCVWVAGSSARPRHLGDEPLTPWGFAARAVDIARADQVALVFGCERSGLSNTELERCHAAVRIASNPEYSSLNLSQAVQVLGYELRKVAVPVVPLVSPKRDHVTYALPQAADMEMFYEHLERVLLSTGFLDPANPRILMRRLRTFYNRANPDRNELNLLRGILTTVEATKKRKKSPPAPSVSVLE